MTGLGWLFLAVWMGIAFLAWMYALNMRDERDAWRWVAGTLGYTDEVPIRVLLDDDEWTET